MKYLNLFLLLFLTGCSQLEEDVIGQKLSPIENPTKKEGYKPLNMPVPPQQYTREKTGSLWQSDKKGFFKDPRASKIGDIIMVNINFKSNADLKNNTKSNREMTEAADVTTAMGLEKTLSRAFRRSGGMDQTQSPPVFDGNVLDSTTKPEFDAKTKVKRKEEIKLKVAATIVKILKNGNMVIKGSQEVRVNNEVRVLHIKGIIRKEDILSSNMINYDRITFARMSYGGRGDLSNAQQPRYGHRLLDTILPF